MKPLWLAQIVWREVLRRKDLYLLAVALGAALLALSSADAFGAAGAGRYILDAGVALAWAASLTLAVTTAGRQLPRDLETGVVFSLLSKPVSRTEVVLGKWLGAWTVSCAATVLFYAVALAAAANRGGFPEPRTLIQALALHAAALAWVCALALAISTRCSLAAALVFSGVALWVSAFMAPAIPELAQGAGRARETALLLVHYAVPHLSLFDLRLRLAHRWGPAPAGAVAAALAYGAGWTALFLLLGAQSYRGRHFRRDAA